MNAPQQVGEYLGALTPTRRRVYLAARRGRVWHWPVDYTTGPAAACTGWPVRPDTAKRPVSVRIEATGREGAAAAARAAFRSGVAR